MPKQPIADPSTPDEFGRIRVRDIDTGHERSVHAAELGHGNYAVLEEPASHPLTCEPLPPAHKSLSGPSARGQQADSKKENDDA